MAKEQGHVADVALTGLSLDAIIYICVDTVLER